MADTSNDREIGPNEASEEAYSSRRRLADEEESV